MTYLDLNKGSPRGIVELHPLNTGADDWVRLKSVMDAFAYKAAIYLYPGTWYCKTVQRIPDGTVIIGNPGITIVSSLSKSAPAWITNSIFTRPDCLDTPVITTTISTNAVPGESHVHISAGLDISVGDSVDLDNNDGHLESFFVVSYAGTLLTLDKAIQYAFLSASSNLHKYTAPRDITIQGNGMRVTGTGDRVVSMVGAWNCHVSGLYIYDTDLSEYVCSFDLGSRACSFRDMQIINANTVGLALEGAEGCSMTDCWVIMNSSSPGILVQGSTDVEVHNCHVRGVTAGAGLEFGYITDGWGCRNCKVVGGSFVGNGDGIRIRGGSRDIDIISADCSYNTGAGIDLEPSSGHTAGRIRATNCHLTNNVTGILIDGVSSDNIMRDCYTENNTTNAVRVTGGADLTVCNLKSSEDLVTYACYVSGDSSSLWIGNNSKITSAKVAGIWGVFGRDNATLEIDGLKVTNPSGVGYGIGVCTLVSRISNFITSGCATGIYAEPVGVTNTSVRIGQNVDTYSATTPMTAAAGAYFSTGTAVLNSSTAVVITFPDVKSTEFLKLTRTVTGGTPGAPPLLNVVATPALLDGDMEAAGVGSWGAWQSVLSKSTTNPHTGTQCLNIAYDGANASGFAYQGVLVVGNVYRIRGYARGDGTAIPKVYDTGTLLWTGTSSSTWQYFDIVRVAAGAQIHLRCENLNTGLSVGFDDITITAGGWMITGITSDTSTYSYSLY